MPIIEQVENHAHAHADKFSIVINGQSLSYSTLVDRSNAVSQYISSLQTSRDNLKLLKRVKVLVANCLGNNLAFTEWFVGSIRYPFASAVIDPNMKSGQIKEIFERLVPDLAVVTEQDQNISEIAKNLGIKVVTPSIFEGTVQGQPLEMSTSESNAYDDVFLVNFTSGTTSSPKAFTRSRLSWRKSLQTSCDFFEIRHGPTTLCPGALTHGLALYALAETLFSGGTFHTVEWWDPEAVIHLLSQNMIDRLVVVPTMINSINEHTQRSFESVNDVLTAGAKLNQQHLEMILRLFPNARVREYYGTSELGFVSSSTLLPSDDSIAIQSVGKAFPTVSLSIQGQTWKEGYPTEPGLIYVQSDFLCDGYLWGDDGMAFRVDEAGATVGDIGKIDESGALWVLSREGDMVVTGGNNVYPAEVECALEKIDCVDSAVVFGLEDEYLGQKLVAVYCGTDNIEHVLGMLSDELPRYKIPREIYRTGYWPLTSSGKIARNEVENNLKMGTYDRVQPPT